MIAGGTEDGYLAPAWSSGTVCMTDDRPTSDSDNPGEADTQQTPLSEERRSTIGAPADTPSGAPSLPRTRTTPHQIEAGRQRESDQPPIGWREPLGVIALVFVADLTIYRGEGFAGLGFLFAMAPLLLWLSAPRSFPTASLWVSGGMLLVLAAKLLWCGSAWLATIGFALVVAYAMALAGFCPYVPEVLIYAAQTVHAGLLAIIHYGRQFNTSGVERTRPGWMSVALPVSAFVLFASIFVLANPDVAAAFGERFQRVIELVHGWIEQFVPDFLEIFFWIAAIWIVLGLVRPVFRGGTDFAPSGNGQKQSEGAPAESTIYAAFRNTLVTVIALFAVYLLFEFGTLWFREFPKGFYYSGYAHEGAAWLTIALALATLMLSLVFRGDVLRDPRIARLRRLAWLWSLENVILAIAVYNRLFIYIGFNGMTRMRIVGLYGMTAVLVGFVLVLVKIAHNHGFLWLVRRHLWTLAIAVYLLALTPSDAIVVSYNVSRILNGDPAPSVQINVHPINSEGVLLLRPLLECDDEIIREGVAAMLYVRAGEAQATVSQQRARGWTAYQLSDALVNDELNADEARWSRYANEQQRAAALKRFRDYAYQWY